MNELELKRNGRILNRKYRKYLIPSIGTAIAVSLNEFVDSIVVANLLDSKAMTIVNLGMPIQLISCAIFLMFGIGGSTLYAEHMGKRQKREAGAFFSVSMLVSVLLGILLMVVGLAFSSQISGVLNADSELLSMLVPYIRVSLVAAPVMITVLTMVAFLPAAGSPNLATTINIVANVVNLMFDYIYIRIFHMGVEGAALATMTGYIVGLIILIPIMVLKKTSLEIVKPGREDLGKLKWIIPQGAATSAGQVGYAVQFTLCNKLAYGFGGTSGLMGFSVCMQLISIASIILQGVSDAMAPLAATLKGQRDTRGVNYVVRTSLYYQTVLSGILVLAFEIAPTLFLQLFNVRDVESVAIGCVAVRIFAPAILIRGVYVLFSIMTRINHREKYAIGISLADGVVTVIVFSLLLTRMFGLTGLWLTFPVRSALILLVIVMVNRRIAAQSEGRISRLFLLENPVEQGIFFDVSIDDTAPEVSALSEGLRDFCLKNGVEERLAYRVSLLGEEMAIYIRNHREQQLGMDVLARVFSDEVTLEFRSEGTPYHLMEMDDVDIPENILMLQKLASRMENDYILGMNSTRLTFERKEKGTQ